MSDDGILHLVKVRFDRRRPDITQEWLDRRYKFFTEHTLPSLLGQTNRDWVLWLNFQEGMSVQEQINRFPNCFTGLETCLSVGDGNLGKGMGWLNKPETRPKLHDAKWVYVTRIDSDDLFAPDALALARAVRPRSPDALEASMFRRGYLYDLRTGELGVYNSPSTPFHTVMFPAAVFRDPARYAEAFHKVGDHSQVNSRVHCHQLPDFRFTVLIHGGNFLSDMAYAAEPGTRVEAGWSRERFLTPPVVFDVDDFCNEHAGVLHDLWELKKAYPNFKCTLFTIPEKTGSAVLEQVRRLNVQAERTGNRGWIELAVHGIHHAPNEELRAVAPEQLGQYLHRMEPLFAAGTYARGFRPPGWFATREHMAAVRDAGLWGAYHLRDRASAAAVSGDRGYYLCDDARPWPYWHGHAHDTCGNWLRQHLPALLTRWPADQAFAFVSEAVLVPQRVRNERGVLV